MSVSFSDLSDAIADLVATTSSSLLTVHGGGRRPSSGVAWSADGLVFCAAHTLEREDDLAVTLPTGARVAASLVGVDPSTDLALLRVQVALTPPEWAEAGTIRPGHLVLALGRPRGEAMATLGLIRAVGGASVTVIVFVRSNVWLASSLKVTLSTISPGTERSFHWAWA